LKTGLDEDYDFSRCLDSVSNLNIRPQVMVRAEEVVSCLSLTFAFASTRGNVGEPLPAQVVITSHARQSTAPIIISQLLICFDGGLKDIGIKHEAQQEPGAVNLDSNQLHGISLDTEPSTAEASAPVQSSPQDGLLGACDLTLSPGSKKILSFDLIPKDSGVVRVANITSTIETDSFKFRHIVAQADQMRQEDYWQQTTEGLSRTPAGNRSSNEIRIHPKPPKMRIEIPSLQKEYLTDETVTLEVEITNDEDDDAEVTLEARFLGQADTVPTLAWTNDATAPGLTEDPLTDSQKKQTPSNQLGHVEQSGRRKIHVTFMAGPQPTEAVLEIKALYHLIAEPDTPVTKLLVHEIVFDRPFEANYDFQPSIDAQPMPNYFHIAETKDPDNTAQGLRQLWTSTVRLASIATEPLIIEDVTLHLNGTPHAAICTITSDPTTTTPAATAIAPNGFHESRFSLLAQKLDLDDRRPTTFTFHLQTRWRRAYHPGGPPPLATTTLSVPNLLVPFGEPRVLAAVLPSLPEENHTDAEAEPPGSIIIPLAYTIENPSTHVLTFSVAMETSDAFAFSGPKAIASLRLVPLSRRTLRYRIFPLVSGRWITPELRVLDTGFQQVVRVQGTGPGMRIEGNGAASFWVADAAGE
ncbi:MAG: hypothetical protein LQ345_005460, partial [Seirophora villosa]